MFLKFTSTLDTENKQVIVNSEKIVKIISKGDDGCVLHCGDITIRVEEKYEAIQSFLNAKEVGEGKKPYIS